MSRQKGLRVMSVFELPAPRAGVVSSSWDFHRVRGAKHTAGTNGFHGAPRRTWGDAKGLLITAPCFGRKRSEVVRTMSCQKTPPANPGGTVPGRHELVAIESQLRAGVGQADPSVESKIYYQGVKIWQDKFHGSLSLPAIFMNGKQINLNDIAN